MAKFTTYKEREYFQLQNCSVLDLNMNDEAFRLYAYLMSMPNNWQMQNNDVIRKLGWTVYKLEKAVRSLKSAGYLERVCNHVDGRYEWDSNVYETPRFVDKTKENTIPRISTPCISKHSNSQDIIRITSNKTKINNKDKERGVKPRPPIFSEESIIIQFKAKPEFLECRNQFTQFDDSIIDNLLLRIAKDVIETGRRTITSAKFINWLEVEVNKRAKKVKSAPTEHDLLQNAKPESISAKPENFGTRKEWEEFVESNGREGIRVNCGQIEYEDACNRWLSNERYNVMNNFTQSNQATQSNDSSVEKKDYSKGAGELTLFGALQNIHEKYSSNI